MPHPQIQHFPQCNLTALDDITRVPVEDFKQLLICPQVLDRPRDNKDTHQAVDTDFLGVPGVCEDLCGLFVVLQLSYLMDVNIVRMSFTLCGMKGPTESGLLQENIIKMHCNKEKDKYCLSY